jgi:TonB-linked SusC/RagA family outer membrane protein
VKEALETIEKQSEFFFLYSEKIIDVSREVNIQVQETTIDKILDIIFAGSDVNYAIKGRQIVLTSPETGNTSDSSSQQQKKVTGKVTDRLGNDLQGVTVAIKGTTTGVITDVKGNYSISNIPGNAVLQFSFVGMRTQEVKIGGRTIINVSLDEEVIGIDEVVVVGYGTQKKVATTSSVSTVKGNELVAAPVANITNSIIGRLPGVLSFQNSGEPGSDAATIRIRGIGTTGNAAALVIVDGIPGSLATIDPNDVESVTVLKDAAAVAPYGLGGANGVVLITTKRGKEGKVSINYKTYYGVQGPTFMPEYLDSYGYANALNTANENVGVAHPYSDEVLQKFKDGSDPDHYPNTDWVHEIVNFKAPMSRQNLTFTGGTKKLRYFSNLGYLSQEGIVSTIKYRQYNVLLNVDADVTNTTIVSADVTGTKTKTYNPSGATGTGIFTDVTEISPTLPLKFTNGLPAHAMLPNIYQSGYNNSTGNTFNMKLQIEQRVPFIPGLKFKGAFDYRIGETFDKTWTLPRTFYKLDASDQYIAQATGPVSPTLSETITLNESQVLQGYINYDRSFGKHVVSFLGVYEGRNGNSNNLSASRVNYDLLLDELSYGSSDKNNFTNAGTSSKNSQMGWVYRLSYSYNLKYFFESSGRYDGHYYFAPGKRFAFFPSISTGWRISEEKFFKEKFPWIDNLKIRGSYGKSGNLAGNPFQYMTSYLTRSGYIFGGTSPVQVLGTYESAQPNIFITWETADKTNVGMDLLVKNGKIDMSIDLFKERRSNMLLSPATTVPSEYGIGLSQVNAGIMENRGIDFSIGTRQELFKDFQLNAIFNLTYAKNKLIQTYETAATYNNPNRRQTGRSLNTQFGLQAMGLYQVSDFDETGALKAGLPVPSYGAVKPGDIRYADLAGAPGADGKITGPDNIININDYTVIGDPLFPQMIFGLNVDMSYKGFDLTMLWQGAGKSSIYIFDELAYPFFNGAKIYKEQLNYWTPENPNADFPRLTPTTITNNIQTSSFWLKDGSYLRLKTMEIGYSLPSNIMNLLKMKSVRFFVSGQNLLTFCKLKYIDPELANNRARYYFQQKVYACGIDIGF